MNLSNQNQNVPSSLGSQSAGAPTGSQSGPTSTIYSSAPSIGLAPPASPNFIQAHLKLILIAVGVLVLIGGGAYALMLKKPATSTTASKPSASNAPAAAAAAKSTKASLLTGVELPPAEADKPLVGVMIENSPEARPQSGLSEAGVVYEANAEGGITRFLALYLEHRPVTMGPVRSLRTYYLDWGLEYGAPITHAGGNADALDLVGPLGLKDMNALSNANPCCFRTNDRYAPHNLYTSAAKLDAELNRQHFIQPASFVPNARKPDAGTAKPAHPTIKLDYSSSGFAVEYRYDASTNDYARWMAGTPHIDRNNGKQIHVKNVVVEMMPTNYGTTRIGEQTVLMGQVGKGKGWVMRDGDVVECTWVKDSHSARTKLLDASGKEIPLDIGNTWYSIVPAGRSVTF